MAAGRRSKTQKLLEIQSFKNVREYPEELKGQWNELFFKNNNPITLELGCGRGEYSIALAQHHPERNYIGVDIKGARLWVGSRKATRLELSNVGFARFFIENIALYFAPDEISEIWVPFPDPYPKPSKEQKRLISRRFLNAYKQVAADGATIHFKTDNPKLMGWAAEMLPQQDDLDIGVLVEDVHAHYQEGIHLEVASHYQELFLAQGHRIGYIKFRLWHQPVVAEL